jgi:hypothetical protein
MGREREITLNKPHTFFYFKKPQTTCQTHCFFFFFFAQNDEHNQSKDKIQKTTRKGGR